MKWELNEIFFISIDVCFFFQCSCSFLRWLKERWITCWNTWRYLAVVASQPIRTQRCNCEYLWRWAPLPSFLILGLKLPKIFSQFCQTSAEVAPSLSFLKSENTMLVQRCSERPQSLFIWLKISFDVTLRPELQSICLFEGGTEI